jgi:DNA-binding ferritin-like protein
MVQANTYAGQKLADEVGGTRLVSLLTVMKALYLIHQTHHWRTNGASYYADHLLFQRIYEESLEYIDGMAERAIGTSNNPWVICPMKLAKGQLNVVHFFCEGNSQPSPEQMVNISLKAELAFLAFLKQVVEAMRQEGSSTDGVEDLIQGTASKHEEFVYLLQQRSR